MVINKKLIFEENKPKYTNIISNKISAIIMSVFTCLIVTSSINDVKQFISSNKFENNFFKECGIYINSQIMIDLTGNKRGNNNQDDGIINIKPMGFAFNPFEDFMNLMMNDIRQFEHDPLFNIADDDDEEVFEEKRKLNSNVPAKNNKKQGKKFIQLLI